MNGTTRTELKQTLTLNQKLAKQLDEINKAEQEFDSSIWNKVRKVFAKIFPALKPKSQINAQLAGTQFSSEFSTTVTNLDYTLNYVLKYKLKSASKSPKEIQEMVSTLKEFNEKLIAIFENKEGIEKRINSKNKLSNINAETLNENLNTAEETNKRFQAILKKYTSRKITKALRKNNNLEEKLNHSKEFLLVANVLHKKNDEEKKIIKHINAQRIRAENSLDDAIQSGDLATATKKLEKIRKIDHFAKDLIKKINNNSSPITTQLKQKSSKNFQALAEASYAEVEQEIQALQKERENINKNDVLQKVRTDAEEIVAPLSKKIKENKQQITKLIDNACAKMPRLSKQLEEKNINALLESIAKNILRMNVKGDTVTAEQLRDATIAFAEKAHRAHQPRASRLFQTVPRFLRKEEEHQSQKQQSINYAKNVIRASKTLIQLRDKEKSFRTALKDVEKIDQNLEKEEKRNQILRDREKNFNAALEDIEKIDQSLAKEIERNPIDVLLEEIATKTFGMANEKGSTITVETLQAGAAQFAKRTAQKRILFANSLKSVHNIASAITKKAKTASEQKEQKGKKLTKSYSHLLSEIDGLIKSRDEVKKLSNETKLLEEKREQKAKNIKTTATIELSTKKRRIEEIDREINEKAQIKNRKESILKIFDKQTRINYTTVSQTIS